MQYEEVPADGVGRSNRHEAWITSSIRLGDRSVAAAFSLAVPPWAGGSNFTIGVISDEISQDFDRACYVLHKQHSLDYVELREMWARIREPVRM
jgi:hypothetical protein